MKHTISGHNFHGRYGITLVGPAEGFVLSRSQTRRVERALCPSAPDCKCGGGYGDGPDADSARLEPYGYDKLRLVPARDE
ncbi:MAG: hypothetical protein HY749_16215 [Gammaproteobacteria bacterium]|nr:hypothetical protein [Gammaproteobacteria bacterium]